VLDLLRIVEHFAIEWDDLPVLIPDRSQYRILIAAGNVGARFAVIGQLAPAETVELVQLDIDSESTW
jgi:hypothetical protein